MKALLSILIFSSMLSACELGDDLSKCDLNGYKKDDNAKIEGQSYIKQTDEITTILVFNNNVLTAIGKHYPIEDINHYNNNDTKSKLLMEMGAFVRINDSTGGSQQKFNSAEEAINYINKKIDFIKMDSGSFMMVNQFQGDNENAAKILTCEFSEVKSNCNTCNFIEGKGHSDTCKVYFLMEKNK